MTRQTVETILGVVVAFACLAGTGLAQSQATNGTQPSGDRSAAAIAQEASNPFANSWALQVQQNNNWTEMLRGDDHTRVQSNLLFQPLISLRLTEKQGLIIRPMVPIANSVPHFDQSGQNERTAGVGDTVLAFALPRSLFGGRLMVGAGPTFIFPTASKDLLSQDTWQLGPDVGAVLLGKHFISYAFAQQWFKVGGDGRDTSQMSGTFNFTYLFKNGWTIGTQPHLSVDWKAPEDQGVAFSIGPQLGKMCKCGGIPTLLQLQVQYLPGSSRRRRSEVEYSAASDSDDPGPHQEGALLTVGRAFCTNHERRYWMSRAIAVHVVAGMLFVGVGTPDAQESISRPAAIEVRDTLTSTGVIPTTNVSSSPKNDMLEPGVDFRLNCVAGIEGDVGVRVAIAPYIPVDDSNDDIEKRQDSATTPRDAGDSPQAKSGTIRRWFTAASFKMLELVVRGVVHSSGR